MTFHYEPPEPCCDDEDCDGDCEQAAAQAREDALLEWAEYRQEND